MTPRELAIHGLAALSCGAALAADSGVTIPVDPSFALYRVAPADDPAAAARMKAEEQHRLAGLRARPQAQDHFSLAARVSITTEKKPVVLEAADFLLPESSADTRGWQREGPRFAWHGNSAGNPAEMALVRANAAPASLGSDFDSFQVEYSLSPNTPVCMPQLDLAFAMQPLGPHPAAPWSLLGITGASSGLKPMQEFDGSQATWRKKDLAYLAGRLLGLAPDDDWRYAQDGGMAVLQRRMHAPLQAVEAIDIAFIPNMRVLQVNLVVALTGSERGGDVLEITVPANSVLPDGRPGIRVAARDALEAHFGSRWAARAKQPADYRPYLREVLVFVAGEAHGFAALKSVQKISLLGVDAPSSNADASRIQAKSLPAKTVPVNEFRQRLLVDLRSVYDMGNAQLKDARLRLVSPAGSTDCAIRIESASALSTYNGSVPTFVRELEGWVRRLGSPVDVENPPMGRVMQPGIIAHLPFSSFTAREGADDRPAGYTLDAATKDAIVFRAMPREPARKSGVQGSAENRRPTEEGTLLSSLGATLQAGGDRLKPASVKREGDTLLVESSSGAVSVAWPLDAAIGAETWFFLGVPEGAAQIGEARLALTLADGRVQRRRVEANRPVHVSESDARVREVRLELWPLAYPYRLRLSDMAFFAPATVSHAESMTVRLPIAQNVKPTPVLAPDTPHGVFPERGRITGFAGDRPVRFTTPLDPPVSVLRELRVSHLLPPPFTDEDACPLTLRLDWERGSTERRLCFAKRTGSLAIPYADLAGDASPSDRGPLRSIDWTLSIPGHRARGLDETFELNFELDGITQVSMQDQLRHAALFRVGNRVAFADPGAFASPPKGDPSKPLLLPLPRETLTWLMTGPVETLSHPLFSVQEIVATPDQPLPEAEWITLTEPSPAPAAPSSRLRSVATGAAIVVLVAAVLFSSWKRKPQFVSKGRTAWARVSRLRVRAWAWSRAAAVRHWRAANFILIAIALGPGLFAAGRLGWTFPGAMVLLAAGFLAAGAYCHVRAASGGEWPNERRWARGRVAMFQVAVVVAVWSLGYAAVSADAKWGFAPLGAAAFGMILRAGSWKGKVSRNRAYVALAVWAAVVAAIYQHGSVSDFGSERNLYYVAGAFLAAFLVRACVVALAPALQRVSPALADRIYGSSGGVYLSGAVVMLALTALALGLKQEQRAEQLAIISYYCMLFGTVKEVLAFRRSIAKRRAQVAAPEST